jgi:hypothetical protein
MQLFQPYVFSLAYQRNDLCQNNARNSNIFLQTENWHISKMCVTNKTILNEVTYKLYKLQDTRGRNNNCLDIPVSTSEQDACICFWNGWICVHLECQILSSSKVSLFIFQCSTLVKPTGCVTHPAFGLRSSLDKPSIESGKQRTVG